MELRERRAQVFLVEGFEFIDLLLFEPGSFRFGECGGLKFCLVAFLHHLAALFVFVFFLLESVRCPLEFDLREVPIMSKCKLFQRRGVPGVLFLFTLVVRILPVRGIRHVLDAEVLGRFGLLLLALLLLDQFVGKLGFEFRTGLPGIFIRGEAGFEKCDFEGQQFILVLLLCGDFSVGELFTEFQFFGLKIGIRDLRFVLFQFEEFVGELYFEFRPGCAGFFVGCEAGFECRDFEGQQFPLVFAFCGDFSVGEFLAKFLFFGQEGGIVIEAPLVLAVPTVEAAGGIIRIQRIVVGCVRLCGRRGG